MRQTVGATWTLQLVVVFILLFVGYIVLTLNYSRTIKIKNEMISIVEKYDGITNQSIGLLNNFLVSSNYNAKGTCENKQGVYGVKILEEGRNTIEEADGTNSYYYCIRKYEGANKTNYYQITLFYKFNLPVIGDLSNFSVKGSTSNFQSHDRLPSISN